MRVSVALATLCLATGAFAVAPAASAQQAGPTPPPPSMITPPPTTAAPTAPPPSMAPNMPPGGAMAPGAPGGHMNVKQRFAAANTTNDGRLTPDQAQAAGWKGVARHFQEIDTDHKGYVTLQDIKEWQRARKAAKRGTEAGAPSPPAAGTGAPPPPPGQQY